MLSCKVWALPLAVCALVLGSCLQAGMGEFELESLPRAGTVTSDPFAMDGGDVLVVTLQGAAFRQDPSPEHFVLTRGDRRVALDMLLYVGGGRIVFGFREPPAIGGGYRFAVLPAAIQSGAARTISVRVIESGRRAVVDDTRFGSGSIHSVSHGLGRFVAVGDGGAMAVSFDGESWAGVRSGEGIDGNGFVGAIRGVAASDGEFFAVGDGARMAFSGDGFSWTGHRLHDSSGYGETNFHGNDIRAAAFGRGATGGGRFVIAGDGGRSMFRWDGDQWREGTGIGSAVTINTVAWGDTGIYGRLVAGGAGGEVYHADEGIGRMTWHRALGSPMGGYAVNASAFGNGVFVIGGDGGRLARSEDGIVWQAVAGGDLGSVFGESGVLDIAFGSGVFVAVGHDGIMAKSADGLDWSLVSDSAFRPWDRISGVATDGAGWFVAVGNSYVDNSSRIVRWFQKSPESAWPGEPDFIQVRNWSAVPLVGMASEGGTIRGVAWNGERYVAVGDNIVAVSSNGVRWTEIVGEWVFDGSPVHFRDVAWGDGRFVAVGYRPGARVNAAVAAFSDDGETWTFVRPDYLVLRQPVGAGATLLVDPRIYAVAFAGGYFVAVGERAWSAWSPDGANWFPVWIAPFSVFGQNDINQNATAVASDGSVFVVGGTMGRLASSSDGGRSWDWIANGLLDGEFNDIMALAYGGGRFVAAGADGRMSVADAGRISSAGYWRRATSGIGFRINAVAWGAGSFVAVGNSGSLAFSGDGAGWTVVEPGPGWDDGKNIYSVVAGSRFVAGGRAKIIFSE